MFDLAHNGDIAWLTLNRPEARNAIPATGWAALERVLREAEGSGAKVLIVRGAGTAFCAGADLADFPAMRADAEARTGFRTAMRAAIERLAGLALPTIAAIDGACFGAGVALAMACDVRVVGAAASFAITPAKFGISYPQEDVARLVALIGPGQASRLLLSAGSIDAAEAVRIGLAEILAGDAAHEQAEPLARAIAAGSAASQRTLKHAIALARDGKPRDEDQDRMFDALIASEDFTERLAAARRR